MRRDSKIVASGSVPLAWARHHPGTTAVLTRARNRNSDWCWRTGPRPDGLKVVWCGVPSAERLGDENWNALWDRAK